MKKQINSQELEKLSIIDPKGIMALRENGYKNTSFAISELIDNSIVADAKNIKIIIIERLNNSNNYNINDILIVDDGNGMDSETLQLSLRFGGGKYHDAVSGLSKYGMGLPNSSASQSSRFEVYTWQKPRKVFYNYFDFKEIIHKNTIFLNKVIEKEFPKYFSSLFKFDSPSGTVVHWSKCDKLTRKTARGLIKHLEKDLGRIFRYYLKKGINIKIQALQCNGYDYSVIKDLSRSLKIFDPLFLTKDNFLPPPFNEMETNSLHTEYPIEHEEIIGNEKIKHIVNIKCSIANIDIQRLGGNSDVGEIYGECTGISILRADRELDLGHFGFLDYSEPRHRWWSIEVRFEAISDHLFGVDNSKQHANKFKNISSNEYNEMKDEEVDHSLELLYKISKSINENITEMMKIIKARRKGEGSKIKCPLEGCSGILYNNICDTCGFKLEKCPQHDNILIDGKCEICEKISTFPICPKHNKRYDPNSGCFDCKKESRNLTSKELDELKKLLVSIYPEYANDDNSMTRVLNWFLNTNKRQFIIFRSLTGSTFYDFKTIGNYLFVEINTNHPFYDKFVGPILDTDEENQVSPLLLMIGSLVEAELKNYDNKKVLEMFRDTFALDLKNLINTWEH